MSTASRAPSTGPGSSRRSTHGIDARVVAGRNGRLLDREAAEQVLVRALTSFSREPVALPLKVDQTLTAKDLAGAEVKVETALSAPGRPRVRPGWLAPHPREDRAAARAARAADRPRSSSPGRAPAVLREPPEAVDHAPKDASFAVGARNVVRVVPAEAGRRARRADDDPQPDGGAALDDESPRELVVASAAPERTTRDAKAMGITGLVGAYQTFYGGVANRIHNVQLVAHLIDDHYIAPGAEFSFNDTTGERNEDKGFLEAPVIINGELENGLGGGVCQVSTTTFNAAYEAGLSITERTNHALYISHYPQGRDATVNYPDLDLKFVNDTGHWLWLRTFVSSSSLTVALYGTPQNRRVESEVSPLVETGAPTVKRIPDPNMLVGQTALEESGQPARSTSVRRRVYDSGGELLYDHTWYSSYRSEPRVIRYGTKPPPVPRAEGAEEEAAVAPAAPAASAPPLALGFGDRLREPGRDPRGPVVPDGDAGVRRPAVGDLGPVALDRVVEAEAGASHVSAARPDREPVVEAGRVGVAGVRLERQRVDSLVAQLEVTAPEAAQVLDPRRLEPDQVRGVVGDALRVRLGEAHRHVVGELEITSARSIAAVSAASANHLNASTTRGHRRQY